MAYVETLHRSGQEVHRLRSVRTRSNELMERFNAHCSTHGESCFNEWGPSRRWLAMLALQKLG